MIRIKRLLVIFLFTAGLYGGVDAGAQTVRHTFLKVSLHLQLDSLRPGKKDARVLTPVLSDGEHRQALRPVIVNGRWRHLMYLRKAEREKGDEYVVQADGHIGETAYTDSCLYSPWMKEAKLWLAEDLCGCGGDLMQQSLRLLAEKVEVTEEEDRLNLIVQQPAAVDSAGEKHQQHKITKVTLHLDYLTFPLDRTELLPDFGNNRVELQKLGNALDSLIALPQCHIELVNINGYASPDGPYRRNDELAYGRTLSLRDYLQKIRRYRELPFRTASVAEDWQGLKEAVEKSDIPYREELLMIINTDLAPDKKEMNIKKLDGGKAYRILKREFLPQLRRTVCEIHYTLE